MSSAPDPLFTAVQRALSGQYSLERELGRGGMGVVYLAREVELDRLVAIKVLPPVFAVDPDVRARFVREARTAASLSHPNIVSIHRVGEVGDVVFFSMAFVDGMTLGERLRARGPLPPSAASRMLREVAQALAYAHGRGIIHRDVKPDNILLERESGRALVTDFGIAGGTHDETDGAVMGTPQFMSPEQSAAQPLDARSDLYSLGIVGYLTLSGSLPFPGATHAEIEHARRKGPASSLAIVAPSTPPHLVTVVDRALKSAPSDRFQSAEGFANAVDAKSLQRVELPAPLRRWLDTKDPWMTLYVGWSMAWTVATMGMITFAARDAALGWLMVPLPLIPSLVFQSLRAKRLFEQGFTVDDVRAALAAQQAELEENSPDVDQRIMRTARDIVARAIGWLPIAIIAGGMFRLWELPSRGAPLLVSWAVLSLPTLNALGVSVFPRWVSDTLADIRDSFWASKLGALTERVLMIGTRRQVAAHAFRPTEMVLGAAVDDLFKSLPAAYRDQLRDIPDVIGRLKSHASTARVALAQFDAVTIADGDPLLNTRDAARRSLAESVSAIESIRLDLLRLRGGGTDLGPTTTVLHAARRVGDDLDRLRAAQSAVSHAFPLGMDLRPHTPA